MLPAETIDSVFLFIGAFLAAAISGAAGFGGALLLLPLLTQTVGAELAVPLRKRVAVPPVKNNSLAASCNFLIRSEYGRHLEMASAY